MTTAQNWRKERGMATQKLVAEWYDKHLWPGTVSAGSGRGGADCVNAPADIEVKARSGFDPVAHIKQMKKRPPGPFGPGWVVMRQDNQGPQTIGDWVVVMSLADHTEYMLELAAWRRLAERLGLELD